jgi:two-component system, NarL family, captular synthesis response regulator RcsB
MNQLAIGVVVADDHPVIRLGVENALAEAPAIHILGSADNSTALLDLLAALPCDVLVTDYAMPGGAHGDGLELLQLLAERFPDLGIVVMTGLDDPALVHQLQRNGVEQLVSKADGLQHVVAAVMAAYARRRYVSPSIAAAQPVHDGTRRVTTLSPREREVLALYVGGLSVTAIGLQLGLKKQTVSAQKSNAMRKLGVERDAELFLFAAELGLDGGPATG